MQECAGQRGACVTGAQGPRPGERPRVRSGLAESAGELGGGSRGGRAGRTSGRRSIKPKAAASPAAWEPKETGAPVDLLRAPGVWADTPGKPLVVLTGPCLWLCGISDAAEVAPEPDRRGHRAGCTTRSPARGVFRTWRGGAVQSASSGPPCCSRCFPAQGGAGSGKRSQQDSCRAGCSPCRMCPRVLHGGWNAGTLPWTTSH